MYSGVEAGCNGKEHSAVSARHSAKPKAIQTLSRLAPRGGIFARYFPSLALSLRIAPPLHKKRDARRSAGCRGLARPLLVELWWKSGHFRAARKKALNPCHVERSRNIPTLFRVHTASGRFHPYAARRARVDLPVSRIVLQSLAIRELAESRLAVGNPTSILTKSGVCHEKHTSVFHFVYLSLR